MLNWGGSSLNDYRKFIWVVGFPRCLLGISCWGRKRNSESETSKWEGLRRRRLWEKKQPSRGDGQKTPTSDQRQSFEMDLSYLQVLEREKVLEVLRRDKQLRTVEEDRIRWVIPGMLCQENAEWCWEKSWLENLRIIISKNRPAGKWIFAL